LDSFGDFICLCGDGWRGKRCEQDVDECSLFGNTALGCQNGARCINTPGSFHCDCAPGFTGVHCHTQLQVSSDRDVCTIASNAALCGFGTCVPYSDQRNSSALSYHCVCDGGWTVEAETGACIVDIDECEQHREWVKKVQLSNFSSSPIAALCSLHPPVECVNLPGSFRCGACPAGFTGNGQVCLDVDECETDNGGCSQTPLVQCINTNGGRVCGSCPAGFTGDGQQCTVMPDTDSPDSIDNEWTEKANAICVPNQCLNDGICVPNKIAFDRKSVIQDTPLILFRCVCSIGFVGERCEQKQTACQLAESSGKIACQNNGTCVERHQSFYCDCAAGWTGRSCEQAASACGDTFTKPTGSIQFPVTPYLVTNKRNQIICKWFIKAPIGMLIGLEFKSLNIEKSAKCESSHLLVSDHALNSVNPRTIGNLMKQLKIIIQKIIIFLI
jgi:cubilin